MALVSLHDITMGFGAPALLDGASLHIQQGDRICLTGRNGAGKTTLLKLVHGDLEPDAGTLAYEQGMRMGFLDQEVPQQLTGTVLDVVSAAAPAHHAEQQAKTQRLIHEMQLAGGDDVALLSSGFKRRVLLARELAREPDLLLLDEPTNHLDIPSIAWLESFLLRQTCTLLFVTHDRMFLRRLATRIIDLDRGKLTLWDCDYDTYVKRKEAALEVEEATQQVFEKKLAQEEAWIRRGVRERRRRNMGRVKALMQMREARRDRREREGTVRMQLQDVDPSGRLVIKARDMTAGYGDAQVVQAFSTTIMRGDKVGIIGPNGCGKTTLLKALLKELPIQAGRIRHGTKLEVAYFDQLREQLDNDRTVADSVGDGQKTLTINGRPRHIFGFLQDFLFSPDRANTLVGALSGGERNRLLLARLFTKPANVLVLDEPTNDLDMETLELLEELLLDFPGTVLLVSHDRAFLNSVVTSTIAFEEGGAVNEYVGGYDDWLRQTSDAGGQGGKQGNRKKADRQKQKNRVQNKLTYKEKRELAELPDRIEALEARKDALFNRMADPAFYQQGGTDIAQAKAELAETEAALEEAYARWEILDEKENKGSTLDT